MKGIAFLIIFLLITTAYAPAQNVSIGAWSIQWPGTPVQRSECGKNVRQTPTDIAGYAANRVDILALEEIRNADGASQTRKNDMLDKAFATLHNTGDNQWKYLLFPKKSQSELIQLTGIAWNEKTVEKVGDPYRIPMTTINSNDWDRWAIAVKFKFGSNKTDIVVIPVHRKANYRGNFSVRRERETKALENGHELGSHIFQ